MTESIDLRDRTMKTAVVTGCAGFIGSHLCERLVAEGHRVIGIDIFRPYYDRADKLFNLSGLADEPRFDLVEIDLATADLHTIVGQAETVFHLAAQAGVRSSFGEGFEAYARDNVVATQRLFEAAASTGRRRVVWASSSSVYGDAPSYPCHEVTTPTHPRSPYGVTKRACEDLAEVYRIRGLSLVGLRYFTVYGPRQRPDMAVRRLCEIAANGGTFSLFGTGRQTRDITYVEDVVEATLLAGRAERPEALYNVGGGHEVELEELITLLEDIARVSIPVERSSPQAGDVLRTAADTTLARVSLGWHPRVGLLEGLRHELDWVRAASKARSAA